MTYQFGPFELDARKRLLNQTGVAIPLTPKAFELLITLIENRNRLMTKDELMQKIWPDSFVEEGNLTQTISVLRKALGDNRSGVRYIVTFPARGYQFVGTVAELQYEAAASESHTVEPSPRVQSASEHGTDQDELPTRSGCEQQDGHISLAGHFGDRDGERSVDAPIPPTALVGREADVEHALALLKEPDVRLLTITGPGGIGKTRLALEVARALGGPKSGVFFVSVSTIAEPALVPSAIAHALGLRITTTTAVAEELKGYLGDKQVLLVLDNFEQVVSAGVFLAELLAFCALLKIVVTSRSLLRLRAERILRLHPLGLPDTSKLLAPESLLQHPATALFVQRAADADPDFVVTPGDTMIIARICGRLDGLPLAIELAAARVSALTPGEILARLEKRIEVLHAGARDLPERQQTLVRAIEWSYDLLSEAEKQAFRRVSVFVGAFTLEDAHGVYEEGEVTDDLLNSISSLLDKSMLSRERGKRESRFKMLETIREYALDRLEHSGEAETIQRRHAAYYYRFSARMEGELSGEGVSGGLDALEAEVDNLRAAMQWLRDTGGFEEAMGIISSLRRFWISRGYLAEADEWSKQILSGHAPPCTFAGARFLGAAGSVANHAGDYQKAISLLDQGLKVSRNLREDDCTAELLRFLGEAYVNLGDLETARSLFNEVLAIARERGDESGIADSLNDLGVVEYSRGNSAKAAGFFGEALKLCREIGDRRLALCLNNLGLSLVRLGDFDAAAALLTEGLILLRNTGRKEAIVGALESFAELQRARGRFDRMYVLMAAANTARDAMRLPNPIRERNDLQDLLNSGVSVLELDLREAAMEKGRGLTLDEAITYALGLDYAPSP